jgi:indole-3-glycerol phosphate synthase
VSDVLARICADKRKTVAARKAARPIGDLESACRSATPPRGFAARLRQFIERGRYGLIAEIKKASPSRGLIRGDFDPPSLARAYREGGAACLSVLTDETYFQGSDDHLIAARAAVDLPVLRKDFMVDPYQIVESRAIGADCILLILAALDDAAAADLEAAAVDLGMDVLIEVHDERELDRALALRSPLVGINNRNLKTLKTGLATTERLAPKVSADRIVICESGLDRPEDLWRMEAAGASCFLVGTSLMEREDVAAATRALLAPPPETARGSA